MHRDDFHVQIESTSFNLHISMNTQPTFEFVPDSLQIHN